MSRVDSRLVAEPRHGQRNHRHFRDQTASAPIPLYLPRQKSTSKDGNQKAASHGHVAQLVRHCNLGTERVATQWMRLPRLWKPHWRRYPHGPSTNAECDSVFDELRYRRKSSLCVCRPVTHDDRLTKRMSGTSMRTRPRV